MASSSSSSSYGASATASSFLSSRRRMTTAAAQPTTTPTPQILSHAALPSLIQSLDASDVLEVYHLTRHAPLHFFDNLPQQKVPSSSNTNTTTSSSNQQVLRIPKSALGIRYLGSPTKPPLELTLEYGTTRMGATAQDEALPILAASSSSDVTTGTGTDTDAGTTTSGTSSCLYVNWQNEGRVYYTMGGLQQSQAQQTQTQQQEGGEWSNAYYMASITGTVLQHLLQQAVEYPISGGGGGGESGRIQSHHQQQQQQRHSSARRYQPFVVVMEEDDEYDDDYTDDDERSSSSDSTTSSSSTARRKKKRKVVLKSSSSQDFLQSMWQSLAAWGVELQPILLPHSYVSTLHVSSIQRLAAGDSVVVTTDNVAANTNDNDENAGADDPSQQQQETVVVVSQAACQFYAKLQRCVTAIATGDYSHYETSLEKTTSSLSSYATTTVPSAAPSSSSYADEEEEQVVDTDEQTADNEKTDATSDSTTNATEGGNGSENATDNNDNQDDYKEYEGVEHEDNSSSSSPTPTPPLNRRRRLFSFLERHERNRNVSFQLSQQGQQDVSRSLLEAHGTGRSFLRAMLPPRWIQHQDEDEPPPQDNEEHDDDDDKNDATATTDATNAPGDDSSEIVHESSTTGNTTVAPSGAPTNNVDEAVEANKAAQEAKEKAHEAKEAATTDAENKAADAAEAAAMAAQKAADATTQKQRQVAQKNLLSGDGELMTKSLVTCFTDPQYQLLQPDGSVTAYIYLDGATYYRLNLTMPYMTVARVDRPIPQPPTIAGSGGGDFIDWTLAICTISFFTLGLVLLCQRMGFRFLEPLYKMQKWFFSPTDNGYDSDEEQEAMKVGQGFEHAFGEDVIPFSMGGRRPNSQRRLVVPSIGSEDDDDADSDLFMETARTSVAASGPGYHDDDDDDIVDLDVDSNGDDHAGHVEMVGKDVQVKPRSLSMRSQSLSIGSGGGGDGGRGVMTLGNGSNHGRHMSAGPIIMDLPVRLSRDPDLVDLPNLSSSRSKVAVPVSVDRQRSRSVESSEHNSIGTDNDDRSSPETTEE